MKQSFPPNRPFATRRCLSRRSGTWPSAVAPRIVGTTESSLGGQQTRGRQIGHLCPATHDNPRTMILDLQRPDDPPDPACGLPLFRSTAPTRFSVAAAPQTGTDLSHT